jgi:hypothetical protein
MDLIQEQLIDYTAGPVETYETYETYETHRWGPLCLVHATEIFSAAAGIAGAYYPDHLLHCVRHGDDHDSLLDVHREARRRADWDAGSFGCRGPDVATADEIAWETSVVTRLYRQGDDWYAEVRGVHITRVDAAVSAAKAICINGDPGKELYAEALHEVSHESESLMGRYRRDPS